MGIMTETLVITGLLVVLGPMLAVLATFLNCSVILFCCCRILDEDFPSRPSRQSGSCLKTFRASKLHSEVHVSLSL